MAYLNDFYTLIIKETLQYNQFLATSIIKTEHAILKGHFPNKPVVPGVCLTQMVVDAASLFLAKEYSFSKADFIKFLKVVDPVLFSEVSINASIQLINEDQYKIEAIIFSDNVTFMKCKLILTLEKRMVDQV